MSKITKRIQKCPDCGKNFEISIYDSYNISLISSPKSKILKGEIFDYKCPHCKHVHKIVYPCLYHDMKKDIMIWLRPDLKSGDWIFTKEEAAMFGLFNKTGNYTMRVENEYNDFIERIRILDNNLNDKIFEIFRMTGWVEVIKQIPNAERLYLVDIVNDNAAFQIISDKGEVISNCMMPLEPYNKICEALHGAEELKQKFCFEKIDQSWVEKSGIIDKLENLI